MNSLRLRPEDYKIGILKGDRMVLAKAITLAESTLLQDQKLAGEVLDAILPQAGRSLRIGITGAPGVGKSTFIEAFGLALVESGKKVAVLTVDPSSQLTKGSILGDKTRMQELAKNDRAFIRPSPSGRTLGGVTTHTREAILLCEAAGFDRIIVETVGTGQSEIAVKNMVDFFLLLLQPGTGDELQGIKKGIVEMADAIAITKSDGTNLKAAQRTQADFQHALHLRQPDRSGWQPKVLICSALEKTGLSEIRELAESFQQQLTDSGHLQTRRQQQHVDWFNDQFSYLLSIDPLNYPEVAQAERNLKNLVQSNKMTPRQAAQELMDAYRKAACRNSIDN